MRPLPDVVIFRRNPRHQWLALAGTAVFLPHFYFAYQGIQLNREWREKQKSDSKAEAPSYISLFPYNRASTDLVIDG